MSWARSLRLRPGDLLIAALVLALAGGVALCFLPQDTGQVYAEIYQDQTLLKRIPLSGDSRETVTVEGAAVNQIKIDGRTVCFSESTCPDQVCVRSGVLTRAGQTAVCLPNRVIVRLTGSDPEVDIIAGGAAR